MPVIPDIGEVNTLSTMHQNVSSGGAALLKQALFEGAMTAVVVQNTVWRVWLSWSESSARRLAGSIPAWNDRCPEKSSNHAGRVEPPAERTTGARFELFADEDGTRRFRLVSAAGDPMLTSRGYQDAKSARSGMQSLMKAMIQEENYQRKSNASGDAYFEIRAGNNRVLWTSAPYESDAELEADLDRLIQTAREAARAH